MSCSYSVACSNLTVEFCVVRILLCEACHLKVAKIHLPVPFRHLLLLTFLMIIWAQWDLITLRGVLSSVSLSSCLLCSCGSQLPGREFKSELHQFRLPHQASVLPHTPILPVSRLCDLTLLAVWNLQTPTQYNGFELIGENRKRYKESQLYWKHNHVFKGQFVMKQCLFFPVNKLNKKY